MTFCLNSKCCPTFSPKLGIRQRAGKALDFKSKSPLVSFVFTRRFKISPFWKETAVEADGGGGGVIKEGFGINFSLCENTDLTPSSEGEI